ncbi:MAG: hypothetical protein DRO13_01235 [Thermoprotei archaeon]|nr:MAG: hypothetical protein DRO13_01235 [Thermoprotei archaeon]
MERKLRWDKGYLLAEYTSDKIVVRGSNACIEIRPRTIVVRGFLTYYEAGNKKKYIYVYFRGGLRAFTSNKPTSRHTKIVDIFEFRYTRTFYDEYYTIIMPGAFFVEYVILTKSVMTIALSGKRRTYYEELRDSLVIYIV